MFSLRLLAARSVFLLQVITTVVIACRSTWYCDCSELDTNEYFPIQGWHPENTPPRLSSGWRLLGNDLNGQVR